MNTITKTKDMIAYYDKAIIIEYVYNKTRWSNEKEIP